MYKITYVVVVILFTLWSASFFYGLISPKQIIQSDYFSATLNHGGHFEIVSKKTGWHFAGNVKTVVNKIVLENGSDPIDDYNQLSFEFRLPNVRKGSIRLYMHKPIILFDSIYLESSPNADSFPIITTYPQNSFHLTYQGAFAQAKFNLDGQQSPWIFFDDQFHTAILSPASHFMISTTAKNWLGEIISGIDSRITMLPRNYDQKTILVVDSGLNQTISLWGKALTDLQGKHIPANDSDVTLNTLGYWTDHGAAYYYHFDLTIGNYPNTLLAIKNEYQQKHVPIGYMQLDSWWYGPKDKNQGILLYEANPSVWKDKASGKTGNNALQIFQESLRLPTAEHARWIGENSLYVSMYKMSKKVSIDPRWWSDRMSFLKKTANSILFEQDWLNKHAQPAFNLTDPEKFMNQMAEATKQNGLVMQYCMALPQHFLQGAKYSNLSSIRVSEDVFEQKKWENELWTSKFAASLGIWPWVDVLRSSNQYNLLLANLSAGIVGVGDKLETVDAENLKKVIRGDGIIVKPDYPLTPIDRMYLQQARGKTQTPFIASTYTDFGTVRVYYLTIFPRPFNKNQSFAFKPSELGLTGKIYMYNFFNNTGVIKNATDIFTQDSPGKTLSYYVIVPLSTRGVAFLGDLAKFVPLGKKRISDLKIGDTIETKIIFAPNETSLTLFGYADHYPTVTVTAGFAQKPQYNPQTKLFSIHISPGSNNTAHIKID